MNRQKALKTSVFARSLRRGNPEFCNNARKYFSAFRKQHPKINLYRIIQKS
jgi:hypothetical protein